MSNPLAIAAVTHSLRHLLEERFKVNGSGNVTVTTKPLDKARDSSNSGGDQVNLFLYQYVENAAWKNMEIPSQVKPGETGYPPLALNLYYLITVYAQNDDFPEPISHRLLGESMSVFHDHSILSPADIKASLPAADLEKYDLYNQIEKVKITLKTLPEDELNKFWTIFQVPFRFTFVCEVSVVLIESTRPTKIPSPVLKRGSRDQGVDAQANLIPPYPTLSAINFTDFENAKGDLSPSQAASLKKPAAKVGEKLTLTGDNLDGSSARILFNHPFLEQPNEIVQAQFEEQTATEIKVTIPDQANQWLPGFYTVTIELMVDAGTPSERRLTTNGLPLPLAPESTSAITAVRDFANPNKVILTAQCKPSVSEKQRVSLILTVLEDPFATIPNPTLGESLQVVSDRELPAKPRTGKTNTLKFEIDKETFERLGIHSDSISDKKIRAGTYPIRPRLRVDGVDSLIVDYLARPPVFIGQQNLVIPP
jgi:Pvc16 N-terminal domain